MPNGTFIVKYYLLPLIKAHHFSRWDNDKWKCYLRLRHNKTLPLINTHHSHFGTMPNGTFTVKCYLSLDTIRAYSNKCLPSPTLRQCQMVPPLIVKCSLGLDTIKAYTLQWVSVVFFNPLGAPPCKGVIDWTEV